MHWFSVVVCVLCRFVWKLNKGWLVRVPCFALVVERLLSRPQSGMESFLVKVALAMQPEVYVPTERPVPIDWGSNPGHSPWPCSL